MWTKANILIFYKYFDFVSDIKTERKSHESIQKRYFALSKKPEYGSKMNPSDEGCLSFSQDLRKTLHSFQVIVI